MKKKNNISYLIKDKDKILCVGHKSKLDLESSDLSNLNVDVYYLNYEKNLKDKLDLDEKVFTSIDEVESENIKFNVILLSSVLNDVFAQYNINTKDKINNMFFAKFSELLEDNGSLVIVDYAFPDELGELILRIKPDYVDEFRRNFWNDFKTNNKFLELSEQINVIMGSRSLYISASTRYIYELIYHFDLKSHQNSSLDDLVLSTFNKKDICDLSELNGLELVEYSEYFEDSYLEDLMHKVSLKSTKGDKIKLPKNKYIAIFRNRKRDFLWQTD